MTIHTSSLPKRDGRAPLLSSAAARLTFHISIPKIPPHCGNTPFVWREKIKNIFKKCLTTQGGEVKNTFMGSRLFKTQCYIKIINKYRKHK